MAKRRANHVLLFPVSFLLSACTVDVSRSVPSASTIKQPSQQWAIKLQRQSSVANNTLTEINAQDLLPGDLLFSSSIGVTSLGIRALSTSSVSHVAIYIGDNHVAEATGAGVQVVPLRQAMQHPGTKKCGFVRSLSAMPSRRPDTR